MRARFPPRALLAALTLLGLASRGAGSLSPSLTSEDPMRLDLEMNVTRAGDVTVLVWEDTYEEGVDGEPMTVVIDLATGDPNALSVTTLQSLSADVAAAAFVEPSDWAGPGAWTRPRAALVDEVHHEPSTDVVVTSACCSPNLTDHVRRPFTAAEPANLFLTRNGTHEWDPVTLPPNLPTVHLVLGLGSEEDDNLNDGMTFSRVVALRAAVATATYSREYDVTVSYSGAGRPKHAWAPTVILHGYDASNFNTDLAAGGLRREVVREAVAYALDLPDASLAVLEVADEPASERSPGEGACRFNFTVSDVVDPDEVARAWPLTNTASFLEAAKARMLSNALWELVAVSGRRGPGVTATVTAELRPNTAGSWVRIANGAGVEPRDVNAVMKGYAADEKVFVSSVAREYVLSSGEVFSPPKISEIRNAPPTPSTVLDVVHRPGSARRMTALVARFDDADVAERGYHVFRVSFHNQRPGADARVAVLDGSDGGDDPWFSLRYIMLSRPPSPPPMPAPPPKVQGLDTRVAAGPAENSVSPLGTSFEFLFEPLPGCETCGVPTGTTVYARVAKEPELLYGDWEACTAVDVEAVVQVLGGLNVTRTVKRYQLLHEPEALGAYRAQAKSVDEDSFAPGMDALEDVTPVERRYIVGAIVSGTGRARPKNGGHLRHLHRPGTVRRTGRGARRRPGAPVAHVFGFTRAGGRARGVGQPADGAAHAPASARVRAVRGVARGARGGAGVRAAQQPAGRARAPVDGRGVRGAPHGDDNLLARAGGVVRRGERVPDAEERRVDHRRHSQRRGGRGHRGRARLRRVPADEPAGGGRRRQLGRRRALEL